MPADNSYYDDAPAPSSQAPEGKPEPDADASKTETALLPKSIFGGRDLKPGDKCDIEIVSVHEDDYAVKHPETEEPEGGADESGPEPAEAPGPMRSMMED